MLFDLIKAKYLEGYKLKLEFENGKTGIVDFCEYLNKGGIFKRLKNKEFFKKFYIDKDLGTICWPQNIDIAPETLYAKIKSGKK
ncbi:MAG: DUF2442 domain-containing protein [Candidatus Margulisbacteria bacterium]|nr:DUF2442 domain-containing protein [Candidatus Margulisiibacteriota bacterium]